MYKAVVEMKDLEDKPTFKEAFIPMIGKIRKECPEGCTFLFFGNILDKG